ncbi:polysaccharide pyruvyl transferase family protein [uncultured Paludibaculum sp.]|uniref:polysaccharide pyruvyl transferase family protein n=1 Tax=uncultured Paludibaculum sp. TaxID=1765020 RepID=UPI002AABD6F6|nr:polysaccharide pyruvyl transferase family protein [uncultured Paludibaculum sp.]
MFTRRELFGAALATAAAAAPAKAVILRSSWQTVNIGDITHTPGVLRLLDQYLPEATVYLWPSSIDRGVEPMLRRAFPKLQIAKGAIGADGQPDTPELREAFHATSLFIHGSAAGVSAQAQMRRWHELTGGPYGCFGVTVTLSSEAASTAMDPQLKALLDGASFVFTRETRSLENLKQSKVTAKTMGFAPDGTFSFDLRDDPRGDAFLKENALEPGRFIAVVPRLRLTPYHLIRKTNYTEAEIQRRTAINDRHKEEDHAKLREAVVAYVRKTGGRALLCPEMTYELDIIDPLLYDPLPADVKPRIVRRKTFWLPDEAASVYRHAAAVVSSECHSPIIAAAQGTPCMYVHQPEDGIKGQMWKDIGLGDWYFDVEQTTGAAIADRLLAITGRPAEAKRKVRSAVDFAREKQKAGMQVVRRTLLG